MNLYLANLDSQTKYSSEEWIGIFKERFDTDLIDMKIAKFLKPYFKVSMIHVDNKRIKVFQVNCAKIECEIDEFWGDIEPKVTKAITKKGTKSISTLALEKKIAETSVQYEQELEKDIGKQVIDL
jgi:hypothetical protein